mgnify:CR=1 FL=1
MKKLLTILALMFTFSVPAMAKTTPVQVMQDFSVSNPSQTLLVKILSNVRLNKEVMLHEGFYVLGNIQGSGKGFVFTPVKYQNFHNEVFEIEGEYPATFVEVIEGSGSSKGSKILLDFKISPEVADTSVDPKYQDAPQSNISAVVNEQELVIYDNTIPQTMKDFPGIKLNSFDNGSNFNIPRRLIIQYDPMEVNINDLKR